MQEVCNIYWEFGAVGIVPSDGVKGVFGALSSRCMIACMHAMLHIAMSVLGHWWGND